jgi:hypothetical protein
MANHTAGIHPQVSEALDDKRLAIRNLEDELQELADEVQRGAEAVDTAAMEQQVHCCQRTIKRKP